MQHFSCAHSSHPFLCFSLHPIRITPFCALLRPGVPLGAEAVCGGGGRASAQEQQADNRQQLSGGALRGSVFLSTLGECRKDKENLSFYFPGLLILCKCLQISVGRGINDKKEMQEGGGDSVVFVYISCSFLSLLRLLQSVTTPQRHRAFVCLCAGPACEGHESVMTGCIFGRPSLMRRSAGLQA